MMREACRFVEGFVLGGLVVAILVALYRARFVCP